MCKGDLSLLEQLAVGELNLCDYLDDYASPDDVPEWQWIKQNGSFAHRGNSVEPGVYEIMVNVEVAMGQDDIPESLQPVFGGAQERGYVWILFHQG